VTDQRLKLAEGREFEAKTLACSLILDTKGLAHVVADDSVGIGHASLK
jgi:hypothetical protein